MYSISLKR